MNQPVAMMKFRALYDAEGRFTYSGLYEGSDDVDFIGPDVGVIEAGVETTSDGEPKNPCIQWTIRRNEGGVFRTKKPFTGQERDSGKPLDRQGCDVFAAIGMAPEQLDGWFRQLMQEGREGLTANDIIGVALGKTVHYQVGEFRGSRDGIWRSSIDNWMDKETFEKRNKTPGQGRSARPSRTGQAQSPAGGPSVPVGPMGGGGRPGVAPPPMAPALNPSVGAPAISPRPQASAQPALPMPGLPGVPANGLTTPMGTLPLPSVPR